MKRNLHGNERTIVDRLQAHPQLFNVVERSSAGYQAALDTIPALFKDERTAIYRSIECSVERGQARAAYLDVLSLG